MLKDSILLSGYRMAKSLVALFIMMILARILSVNEMGIYQQILLISIMVGSLVPFEMQTTFTYFYNKTSDALEKSRVLSNTFITLLGLGLLAFLAMILIFHNGFFFNDSYLKKYSIWLGLWCFATILGSYLENLYVSSNRVKVFSIFTLTYYLFYLITVVLVAYLSHNLYWIVITIGIMEFLRVILLHLMYLFLENVIFSINIEMIKQQFKYTLSVGSVTALDVIMQSTDKVIISLFFAVETFAVFSIAAKEVPFMAIITVSVITAMLPKLGGLYNIERDSEGALRLWSTTSRALAVIIFPLFWILLFYNKQFIELIYSDVYVGASIIFVVYLLKFPLRFTVFYTLLQISGNQKLLLQNTVITVILNVVLSFLFLYLFGYLGVAAATVVAAYIGVFLQQRDVSRIFAIKQRDLLPYAQIVITFINSGVIALGVYLLSIAIPLNQFVAFILGGILIMFLSLILSAIRKEIDLSQFQSKLSRFNLNIRKGEKVENIVEKYHK